MITSSFSRSHVERCTNWKRNYFLQRNSSILMRLTLNEWSLRVLNAVAFLVDLSPVSKSPIPSLPPNAKCLVPNAFSYKKPRNGGGNRFGGGKRRSPVVALRGLRRRTSPGAVAFWPGVMIENAMGSGLQELVTPRLEDGGSGVAQFHAHPTNASKIHPLADLHVLHSVSTFHRVSCTATSERPAAECIVLSARCVNCNPSSCRSSCTCNNCRYAR